MIFAGHDRRPRRAAFCLNLIGVLGLLVSGAAAQIPTSRHFPRGTRTVGIPHVPGVNGRLLRRITPIFETSIADGDFPGAVVLAVHRGHVIYRGVFGSRSIVPRIRPMRFNTIFDLASLTKVIATTPAIMQLVQEGRLQLDAPVAQYWPAFARHGKGQITIRELMTHFSGLPPDIPSPELLYLMGHGPTGFPGFPPAQNVDHAWHGLAAALHLIEQVRLIHPPGQQFVYSDINFIVLGYLVRRITGEPLNVYDAHHVFMPLDMRSTMFLPPRSLRPRIAPTQVIEGHLRWGQVHDPTAAAMGGVSGMAGLFSDASDLGRYAQCLLNGGVLTLPARSGGTRRVRILGPLTIRKMISPQSPAGNPEIRGLGWDLDSGFTNRGVLFPFGSYGHTGWTGPSIWIDPVTQTYLIIMASRCHPQPLPHGDALIAIRREVANIVAASLDDQPVLGPSNTGAGELFRAYPQSRP